MKKNFAQVQAGVLDYIDREFVSNLDGLRKWAVLSAVSLYTGKSAAMSEQLLNHPVAKMMGIVDEQGMIDVDALHAAMVQAAEKTGTVSQYIPVLGNVTFTRSDVDTLYNCIMAQ